jgi:hypothetical protein
MSDPFRHFIITRFNLRTDVFSTTREGGHTLTDPWYSHRFELFQDICCRSVMNQKNKSFKWLVCFDTTTPEKWLPVVKKIEMDIPMFRTIFCDGWNDQVNVVRSFIADTLDASTTHIITTLLDNDDAISDSFTEEIGNAFKNPREKTIVDCINGYMFEIEPRKVLRKATNIRYGSFLSIIEPSSDYVTILSGRLYDWRDRKLSEIVIKDKYLWLQVVHANNVSNRMHRDGFLQSSRRLRSFHFDNAVLHDFPGIVERIVDALVYLYEKTQGIILRKLRCRAG